VTEETQRHLVQAAECIEDARVLLDNDRFGAAVARAYYAMFHGATAALLAQDIRRSSHHGLPYPFRAALRPGMFLTAVPLKWMRMKSPASARASAWYAFVRQSRRSL
jgi:uncharacterized protein (UPF0332 family)